MAGSASGIVFPIVIGYVLDAYKKTGSVTVGYNLIFLWCGAAYLLAWVLMHFILIRGRLR